jgi:hypothetical protein
MSRLIPFFVLIALFLCGCGSGSETTAGEAQARPHAEAAEKSAYVAAGDRICAGMVVRFAHLPDLGLDTLTLTTRELVKPALPILERSASRLRALERRANSLALESYVSLYDPIMAVVRDRVAAGEAGDATRAHALELQLLDLSNLQRSLAREAGLKSCDVDFIHTFATSGHAR